MGLPVKEGGEELKSAFVIFPESSKTEMEINLIMNGRCEQRIRMIFERVDVFGERNQSK